MFVIGYIGLVSNQRRLRILLRLLRGLFQRSLVIYYVKESLLFLSFFFL